METVNTQGTSGVSLTVGLPFAEAKHDLLVLRNAHGADTEAGHICSNIITLIDAYRDEDNAEARARQSAEVARQSIALAKAISRIAQ